MIRPILLLSVLTFTLLFLLQDAYSQKKKDVYVDKEGVMRWGDSRKEVYGFGINYTAPFAHAYRAAKKLNVDVGKAIDDDVYHFARLGFDAFRVHVWDTEISDSVGNLLDNEHLRMFDYLLFKMKERGMKLFLTPIAFWGNGYPERDDKTPGFSAKYGKDACLTNPEAIKAQENYLAQFVRHVNPFTKLAYKDDPDIVAFEVSNEPHHRGSPEEVKAYINRMTAAIRRTGSAKPVFYNVSHSVHLGKTYFTSDIDGGTFQWYPTGLGARHELRGNFLPNVDKYTMPFDNIPEFRAQAKIVYEFDAADVGRSYIYPAMARSFRSAGIQWATHFAYDPTFMAYANTEYNTHFMNLAYAPQKALSLMLASEVFHAVPRYKKYPAYPANTTFDDFRVSYEDDLAEMVTAEKFIYTNHTKTAPKNLQTLRQVVGYGNSPVVRYDGTGAYFLDKIRDGVWRLEVMPDAIWVDNLFGRNSLSKEVAVINWRTRPIEIELSDLGLNFTVTTLDVTEKTLAVSGSTFEVSPGVYLLARKGVAANAATDDTWKNIRLGEFAAPETNLKKNYVIHRAPVQASSGEPVVINATIVTKARPEKVTLHYGITYATQTADMISGHGYEYSATIPAEAVKAGYLNYYISVSTEGTNYTFPSGLEGKPFDWDFYDNRAYSVPVVDRGSPLYLFNASTDSEELSREWRRGSNLVPGSEPGVAELEVNVEKLFAADPENLNAGPIHDYSMRYNFLPNVAARKSELKDFGKIVLKGKSDDQPLRIQLALIDKDGRTFGGEVELTPENREYALGIADLKPVRQVILPRPYPTFLPYFFSYDDGKPIRMTDVETLQISIGKQSGKTEGPFRFQIESVRLEK